MSHACSQTTWYETNMYCAIRKGEVGGMCGCRVGCCIYSLQGQDSPHPEKHDKHIWGICKLTVPHVIPEGNTPNYAIKHWVISLPDMLFHKLQISPPLRIQMTSSACLFEQWHEEFTMQSHKKIHPWCDHYHKCKWPRFCVWTGIVYTTREITWDRCISGISIIDGALIVSKALFLQLPCMRSSFQYINDQACCQWVHWGKGWITWYGV